MPKIKIIEKDSTGLFAQEGLSNTVYIPSLSLGSEVSYTEVTSKPENWKTTYTTYFKENSGVYTHLEKSDVVPVFAELGDVYACVDDVYTKQDNIPGNWETNFEDYFTQDVDNQLVSVEPKFINCYKEDVSTVAGDYVAVEPILYNSLKKFTEETQYNPRTVSYKIAKRLLRLGLSVLYEQVTSTSVDWDKLTDKNKYDIRFLTSGAEITGSKDMIECAYKRGDCIALIDHTKQTTSVSDLREWFNTLLQTDGDVADNNLFNSCGAGFTPWFTLKNNRYQPDLESTDFIPASFGYLFAYAKAIQNNPEWYAMAGSFRGIIDNINTLNKEFTMSEVEVLQGRSSTTEVELDNENDNDDFAINVITQVSPFGNIVWGNRTLLKNDGTLKATSFLNVRNLVSAVKKQLYFTAKKYTFEQNSDVLWVNFKSQLTPLLDQMQSGNGITGYKIEKLPTNKKARLKAKITIIPIEAVEDFELEVELADSLEVVE